MYIDKISFRTTPKEEEYLLRIAEKHGMRSASDLMHKVLADNMTAEADKVYSQNPEWVYRRTDRHFDRRDEEQTQPRHRSNDYSPMAGFIAYLQKENKRLQDAYDQLRQQYDILEQQLYYAFMTKSAPAMPEIKPQEPDLMTSMIADMETNSKFMKGLKDMSMW